MLAPAPLVQLSVFTHPGRVRLKAEPPREEAETTSWRDDGNEDVVAVRDWISQGHLYVPIPGRFALTEPLLLLVADGMGGPEAGELASLLAAQTLVRETARLGDPAGIAAVVNEAHEAIVSAGLETPERRGMGTTIAGLVLTDTELLWFNVGDSRIYLFRDDFLQQVSIDDVSVAARRLARAENRPTHKITACLGGDPDGRPLQPHCGSMRLPLGSRWLICSDGVSDLIKPELLEACLKGSPAESVLAIYDLAMRSGGDDNLSVIVLDILAPGAAARS